MAGDVTIWINGISLLIGDLLDAKFIKRVSAGTNHLNNKMK